MTRHRVSAAVLLVAGALAPPGAVAAESPVTTAPPATSAPPATAPPGTTTTPTTPTDPSTPDAVEATIGVGDEAAYRAALASLAADTTGLHTIVLTADITVDDGTDPTYTGVGDLTIDGRGFALDAVGTSRLLVMDSPTDASLTLSDVIVRNGRATGDGGGVLVQNGSILYIRDSRFEDNEASGSGGAIEVPLAATVVRSDFTGNAAITGDGGALDAAAPAGEFVIRQSQFFDNRAPGGDGGAVSAIGFSEIATGTGVQRSTFSGNAAQRGGALLLVGRAVIDNSTIVDNVATVSGGGLLVANRDVAAVLYLTLTGNAAPDGANLAHEGAQLFLFFSVFAEPGGGGQNCRRGGPWNVDELLADDDSCGGPRFNGGSPELGPLGDNGGRTLTREPRPGSPLVDAVPQGYGYPSLPGGCAGFQSLEPWDQRGVERPQDGDGESSSGYAQGEPIEIAADCDIGAVEARAYVAPPTGPVPGAPPFTG